MTNNLGLGIGAQPDGVSQLQGAMDDVHLYSRALSLSEIQALAAAPVANSAPVAVADSYSTPQDTAKVVAAARVCSPMTPTPNSDPLTAACWSPTSAMATLSPGRERRLHVHADLRLQRAGQLHLQGQ